MSKDFIAHRPLPARVTSMSPAPAPAGRPVSREQVDEAYKQKLREVEARRRAAEVKPAKEIGGPKGPEPTRYGDWERKGICSDF